jgi:hypothetical protein
MSVPIFIAVYLDMFMLCVLSCVSLQWTKRHCYRDILCYKQQAGKETNAERKYYYYYYYQLIKILREKHKVKWWQLRIIQSVQTTLR